MVTEGRAQPCLCTFTPRSWRSAALGIKEGEALLLPGFADPAAVAQPLQRAEEALLGCLVGSGCPLGIRVHGEAQQVPAALLRTELPEQGEHFPLGHPGHLQLQTEKGDKGSNEGRDTEQSQEEQGAQVKYTTMEELWVWQASVGGSRLRNILFSFRSACL